MSSHGIVAKTKRKFKATTDVSVKVRPEGEIATKGE